jgi:acyl-CoA hydrolase
MKWHTTKAEYADMLFMFSFCERNTRAALVEYQCQYLDQRQHNPIDVFAMVHCNMRKTGTIVPTACANHGPHSMQNEEEVLDAVHANPQASTHWVTYETGLSHSAV